MFFMVGEICFGVEGGGEGRGWGLYQTWLIHYNAIHSILSYRL